MLDDRKLKCIELKAQGIEITEIAKQLGIARNTYYNWAADEEFKAELGRREQEFISSTRQAVISYGPKVVKLLIALAEKGDSEKVRLDALSKLLDKTMSNATKISIDDGREGEDNVSIDILEQETKEFDNE